MSVIPLRSETTTQSSPYLVGMQEAWKAVSAGDPHDMTPAVALALERQKFEEQQSPVALDEIYQRAVRRVATAKYRANDLKNQEILYAEKLSRAQRISEMWLGHHQHTDRAIHISWWEFSLEELQAPSVSTD